MACQHLDRANVMFPPLAPKCHACHYADWSAGKGWRGKLVLPRTGGDFEYHGPRIMGSDGKFYREQRLK